MNEARLRIDHLETALQSNRRIGIAIGILMSRHGVSDDDAFAMLARASQLSNRKLRDIADKVAYEGDLPERVHRVVRDEPDADLGAVG